MLSLSLGGFCVCHIFSFFSMVFALFDMALSFLRSWTRGASNLRLKKKKKARTGGRTPDVTLANCSIKGVHSTD